MRDTTDRIHNLENTLSSMVNNYAVDRDELIERLDSRRIELFARMEELKQDLSTRSDELATIKVLFVHHLMIRNCLETYSSNEVKWSHSSQKHCMS
jgi:hypothetical protein